jgi:predicted AlkP superfamily phosphohydrolase/phosphomutase
MKNIYCIVIDIDGCRQDAFYELLLNREIPNFYSIFKNGKIVKKTYTIFPTNTLPAQTSIFTGVYPKKHGIIGNSWFDRKKIFYQDYTTAENALRVYGFDFFSFPFNFLVERKEGSLLKNDIKVKTIYQILKENGFTSGVIFSHISSGCNFWVRPKRSDMIQYALCHEDYLEYIAFEKTTLKRTIEFLKNCKIFPNLLTLYFSGLDGYSHRWGADTQKKYLKEVVDKLFGEFLNFLKRKINLEEVNFLVISDHGQWNVKKDKFHFLTPFKILPYLQEKKFVLFSKKNRNLNECNLVCTEGGSVFYIRNEKTKDWKDNPSESEKFRLIETLLASQKKLGNWVKGFLIKENEDYKVYCDGKLEKKEIFFKSESEKYPAALERIEGLVCENSGDVISLVNFEEGFYFTDRPHAGEHGSLTKEDSLVPFAVSGIGLEKIELKEECSICEVVPTILKLFGIEKERS